MPADLLSRATSVGGILQQLSVSFGVSLAATLLSLLGPHDMPLTPERFHAAFVGLALLPLLAIPGFLRLTVDDGAQVSGHRPKLL